MRIGILQNFDTLVLDSSLTGPMISPEINAVDLMMRDPDTVMMAVCHRIMRMPHACE